MLTEPTVPKLVAQDVPSEDDEKSKQYKPTWQQLTAAVGTRAPYWPAALRDRETIAAWRPGAPSAVVPACHPTNSIRPLVELAADEPDDSPAAQLCWSLAREIRSRDHASVSRDVQELKDNAAKGGGVPILCWEPSPPNSGVTEGNRPKRWCAGRDGWLSPNAGTSWRTALLPQLTPSPTRSGANHRVPSS